MKPKMNASINSNEHGDTISDSQPRNRSLPGEVAKSDIPVRIQMIGGSGVGKTCFLAGLALLNQQTDGRSFVLPTDAGTKAVFDKLRDTLSTGHWPEKTNIVNKLSFAVVRGPIRVDVELSDFKGEDFTDSMKRGNTTQESEQIRSLVNDADLLMVLLDGASVDRKEDFSTAPLIQAVFQRMVAQGNGNLDVAVVLTKSDLCRSTPVNTSDDLQQLVQHRAPNLANFLQGQVIHTHWIPSSVCGPNGTDATGAPIYDLLAPQGYEAIFDQLFRRQRRPRNRLLLRVAAGAAFVVFMSLSWRIFQGQDVERQKQRIGDRTIPTSEVAEYVSPENEPQLRERYEEDFAKAKKDIEASGNVESIDLVLKRFEQIPGSHEPLVTSGLEQLKSQASDRKEQLLHKQVVDCQQLQTGDCVPLISKYLSEFPDGPHAEDMRKMLDDINQARYLTARGQVKAIPVTSPEALKKKGEAITGFLKDFGQLIDADEKAAITTARDIATELVSQRQYHCKLIRTSGLDTPRDHGVEIYIDMERIANYDDSGDVSEKNWNRDFTISWRSGQNVKVVLKNYDARDQDMAYFENTTPVAIVLLASEQSPSRYATNPNIISSIFGTDFTSTRPAFKVKFECQELPQERLQVISDYLLPGDKW